MSGKARVRCAIYTRKSSEEGLDQAFNSLDAQHEACAAYVASQKHEGWVLMEDRYDDGGISGGTLERPAVQRLLADIDAGRVDRVIVYKVDRLTRSLADFAKLVERFDQAGASFVSVTQSFNTATSMGRLTLNVLLSFAQFEREVTAERIRDKIAASKKKGMWMGGVAPLGYRAKDRTLEIKDAEAETVRTIFALYLELGSIRKVLTQLDRMELRTKRRAGLNGTARGGAKYGRGHLQHLLTNPVYIGRIRHKEKTYDGAHDPIIDQETWDAVQELLTQQSAKLRGRLAASASSPLSGKVIDETGDRLTPSHSNKKGRRYRYYVSHRLIAGIGEADASGWRVSAERLERAFADAVATRMNDTDFAVTLVDDPTAIEVDQIRRSAKEVVDGLRNESRSDLLAQLVTGSSISPDALAVELNVNTVSSLLKIPAARIDTSRLSIVMPWSIRRRGVETSFVIEGAKQEIDQNLIARISQALRWFAEIKAGATINGIAKRESLTPDCVAQIMRLAWLAPDVISDIASSSQPAGLTANAIFKSGHIALWTRQRAWASAL